MLTDPWLYNHKQQWNEANDCRRINAKERQGKRNYMNKCVSFAEVEVVEKRDDVEWNSPFSPHPWSATIKYSICRGQSEMESKAVLKAKQDQREFE